MLHSETQMSIPTQYQRACSALYTDVTGSRTDLMQPLSNRDQESFVIYFEHRLGRGCIRGATLEHHLYYTLLQSPQVDHPPPCSTIHYGQVQKKPWTQLPDSRETVEWSTTPSGLNLLMSGSTVSMESQTRLWYHNGQKQDKEYCVPKKNR